MDKLAFIDVETTGGRAGIDRITEVAIKVVDADEVILGWQSLVNPQCSIPLFIQRLTGITDEMVADAPLFEELADIIDEITQGCVFVAHNARFDYAFFKREFKRLGRPYSRRVLCTVKLAKLLYPQHTGHGMDKLIARHGLPCNARHRAMGDVEAMFAFYRFAREDVGQARFEVATRQLLKRTALPAALGESDVSAIPELPGVYHFYGENEVLLYVGKSVNLYQRVMSHFAADHQNEKEMILSRSVRRVAWFECAGEMGAMLREIADIKKLQPIHNRRLRPAENYFSFVLRLNKDGYLVPQLTVINDEVTVEGAGDERSGFSRYFGMYRSKGASTKALQSWFRKNDLCARLMGQDHGQGPCFAYQTKQCKGACIGEENAELYNLRVQIALHRERLKDWPFHNAVVVIELPADRGGASGAAYLMDQWACLSAIGFSRDAEGVSEADIKQRLIEGLEKRSFDADVYRVLYRFLVKHKRHAGLKVLELDGDELAAL